MASIDIITRTSGRIILLERAIKSVLTQDYTNWQHIIVINDDRDEVQNLLNKYSAQYKHRLLVVDCSEEDTTLGNLLNKGIQHSNSDYIAILDDDDTWDFSFLNEGLSLLQKQSKHVFISAYKRIWEELDNNSVNEISEEYYNTDITSIDLKSILENNIIPPISCIFSRLSYNSIGKFSNKLSYSEDWHFYLRLLQMYDPVVLNKPLANHHLRRRHTLDKKYDNTVTQKVDLHKAAKKNIILDLLLSKWIFLGARLAFVHYIRKLSSFFIKTK